MSNRHAARRCAVLLCMALMLAASGCGGRQQPRHKIGVAQCSADIWREKQNNEMRMEAYVCDKVDLLFATAHDSDERQIQQIDSLIACGIDLLIVAPNQLSTITPAIDRAYDSGIPVIVFERKTTSKKFTAFVGANNYDMGHDMGEYICSHLGGKGRVLEIMGLNGSSPAIERHNGFVDALKDHPGVTLTATLSGDWTTQSAIDAVTAYDSDLSDVDFVFGHNDRMAVGARTAMQRKGVAQGARYCGIDGLIGKDGGIQLVRDSILDATYIYPTHGELLLRLAVNILEGRDYEKEQTLQAALVTRDNAEILLLQSEEIANQSNYLDELHSKVNEYTMLLNREHTLSMFALGIVVLLLLLVIVTYLYFLQKSRIRDEREQITQQKLNFFTQVSHELRTPLTLIDGPLNKLASLPGMSDDSDGAKLVDIAQRNASHLTAIVNKILDAQAGKDENSLSAEEIDDLTVELNEQNHMMVEKTNDNSELPGLLIVDDNADIRAYLHTILRNRYQTIEAPDGLQGLELARTTIPDLIISDVMMPVMDGLEFCKRIKEDATTCHIPVVLLTARAMKEQRIEGYQSGADAYITKPFSAELLLARVENLLLSRHRLKDIFATAPIEPRNDDDDDDQQQPGAHEPSLNDRFIDEFRNYINEHMGNSDLSVEDIGAHLALSRVQLYRKVKALTGLSPVEQLRKARLARAHALLSAHSGTVQEIAYEVGFATPSYFSKCFKEEYGITPGEM